MSADHLTEEASGRLFHGRVTSKVYEGRQKEQFYLYCRQQGVWPREVGGHDPEEESAFFRAYCPLHNVTASFPPTLLLHGTADTDVLYEQSALMATELYRWNIASELITIDGGGHGFDRQMGESRIADTFERALTFLVQHTAP